MENINLDNFKVEELEQRLEMKKWSVGAGVSDACTGSDCNFKGNATIARTL